MNNILQRAASSASAVARRKEETERWKKLVYDAPYTELDEILKIVEINAGHNPTVSHRRRILIETRSGERPDLPARTKIFKFDYAKYEAAAETRRLERLAHEERVRAEKAEEEKDDALRAKRKSLLEKDVTALRQKYNEDTQGGFATREWILAELEKDGPHGGWHTEAKNEGLEIYLGEVASCWSGYIGYAYERTVVRGGFIDMTESYGTKLLWEHVKVLQPLEQKPDARGNILLRTNARTVVKLRKAKHCVLEAILFATGARTLGELSLTGFSGVRYEDGVFMHDVNKKLTAATPFEVYDWQAALHRFSGGSKRGRDGTERRRQIALFDVISKLDIVLIAEALVDCEGKLLSKHAIVWDGWRRLLFIGPGEFDDRGLDGALQLNEMDCASATHVDEMHGMTVSAYVEAKFGISRIANVHALMVRKKHAHRTMQV